MVVRSPELCHATKLRPLSVATTPPLCSVPETESSLELEFADASRSAPQRSPCHGAPAPDGPHKDKWRSPRMCPPLHPHNNLVTTAATECSFHTAIYRHPRPLPTGPKHTLVSPCATLLLCATPLSAAPSRSPTKCLGYLPRRFHGRVQPLVVVQGTINRGKNVPNLSGVVSVICLTGPGKRAVW